MKRICKWFFVVCLIIGAMNLPVKSFAQGPFEPQPKDNPQPQEDPPPIGGDDCHTYNDPTADCPIDGGLGVLLALGVGYGIKKYRSVAKDIKVDLN